MEDFFTEKMHEEFNISERLEIKHRALCVWQVCGFNADKKTLLKWCDEYEVSLDGVMEWKDYWQRKILQRNKKND